MSLDVLKIIRSPVRLAALHRLGLLDSEAEPAFDRLTRLVTRLLRTPMALVSLVDADRQFFKSAVGLQEPWATLRETPLTHSFCQYAVASGEPLIINDVRKHQLLHDNQLIPQLEVAAYAGIPLITSDGHALGSLCALDTTPREWSADDIDVLRDLAASVMTEIELRGDIIERAKTEDTARRLADQLKHLLQSAQSLVAKLSIDQILQTLRHGLEQVLEFDGIDLYWLDAARHAFRPALMAETSWYIQKIGSWLVPLEQGIMGAVARTGRGELVNNSHLDPRSVYPVGASLEREHLISVPIRAQDQVCGVLMVGRTSDPPFTQDEYDLVELFTSYVSLAIENARLYEQSKLAEERQRLLLEQIPCLLWTTDRELRITSAEGIGLHEPQFTTNAPIGTPIQSYFSADAESSEPIRAHQRALAGESVAYELEWRDHIFQAHVEPFLDRQGNIIGCIGIGLDISARRSAEQALEREFAFRTAIIERAADGLCVCHAIGEFPHVEFSVWNDRMTEITGYTRDAINQRGWYQSIYPDPELQARAQARMDRMRYGDDLVAEEWEITRADGERRIVTISTSLIAADDGMAHVLALIHDITERRRMQDELRRQHDLYDVLLHGLSDLGEGVLMGEGSKIVFANEALEQISGYSRADLLALDSISLLAAPENEFDSIERLRRLAAGEEIGRFQGGLRHKDGHIVPLEIATKVLPHESGFQFLSVMRDITARRHAEAALRESEERFRRLSEVSFEGIAIHDRGVILDANQAQAAILGYEHFEIIGKSVLEFATLESREVILQHIHAESELPYEVIGIRKDGTLIPLEVQGKPLSYQGHTVRVAAIRDITQRKQAEEALRASEERFRHLIRDLHVGVLLQGPAAEILLSNEAALKLLGLTEDQLLGRSPLDPAWNVIHEDGSPFPSSTYPVPQAIAMRQPVHDVVMGVYRPLTEDWVWLLMDAEPQFDDDGTIRQVICSFMDITERKRAEAALRESEQRFSKVFHTSPVAIAISTLADGRFLDANASALELYGYSREEVVGHTSTELKLWFDPTVRTRLAETLRLRGALHNLETRLRQGTGEVRDTLSSIELIELGGEPCILSIFHDITERKRADLEREQLIKALKDALANIKTLRGLLPICASCKKIRDDTGYWNQIETYLQVHTDVDFTHSVCPDCARRLYPDLFLD